jgi:hypothetical protein
MPLILSETGIGINSKKKTFVFVFGDEKAYSDEENI